MIKNTKGVIIIKLKRVYEIGDVFNNFGNKEIIVCINKNKYMIRVCCSDGFEYYTVSKDYFDKLEYIENIKLI